MKRLALAAIFGVVVGASATVAFLCFRTDWKVMKTGSTICRINARTGEAYVLANGSGEVYWKRIGKKAHGNSDEEEFSQKYGK